MGTEELFVFIPLPPFLCQIRIGEGRQIQAGHEGVDSPPPPLTCRKPGAGKLCSIGATVLSRRKGGKLAVAARLRQKGVSLEKGRFKSGYEPSLRPASFPPTARNPK